MRVLTALAAAGLITLAGCASSGSADHASSTVDVSVSQCGQGWTATAAGPQHLVIRNTDSRPGEVQLVAPATGRVYADIEPLGPATRTNLDVALDAGRYAMRCLMEDEAAVTGPTVTLAGDYSAGAPGVVPVTQSDLVDATKAYQRYVTDRLPALAAGVATLRARLDDRTAAEHAWLVAHLAYERLGAAYDAFGDLDGAINGLPNGLPRGIHDSSWTGFHRIEYGLWHGQSVRTLRPLVDTLAADITKLRKQFATVQIDPLTLTIRAHEITENALQFSLTGEDDFGSHSDLATIGANLDGTKAVLDILGTRVPNRAGIYAGLARARQSLTGDLDNRAQRERIDSAISELTELLAPVASQLEPRRTS